MKANQDLIGKTITGVVAVTPPGEEAREIWMMQFSDGTHVEFVSPQGQGALRRSLRRRRRAVTGASEHPQLGLSVA